MPLSPSRRTVLTMAAALAAPALRTLPALAQTARARVGVIPIIGSSPIFVADKEGWARDAGLDCWVGGMLESAVGARMNLALATCEGFTYPADLFPSARFFAQDLARPALEMDTEPATQSTDAAGNACPIGPTMTPLDVPGTGAEPDAELLEQWTVQRARLG